MAAELLQEVRIGGPVCAGPGTVAVVLSTRDTASASSALALNSPVGGRSAGDTIALVPRAELRLRIAVQAEDRPTVVAALLDTGGGRALPGDEFDVTVGQALLLARRGTRYSVVGQGEPLRDSLAPQLQ